MICSTCKLDKELNEFSLRDKLKQVYQSQCKSCHNSYLKLHYNNNKKTYKDRAVENTEVYIQRNIKFIKDYLEDHPCACGELDPVCLDFHHLKDKDKAISRLVHNGVSIEKIQLEIKKCMVVCSNCHRKIHAKERATRPIR